MANASGDRSMKVRQSAKIQEIGAALVSEGLVTIDDQAEAIGLPRSTTWSLHQGNHKASGLSVRIINQIIEAPRLPPLVRNRIIEYVQEKAAGAYGHSEPLRRKFIRRLSNRIMKSFAGLQGGTPSSHRRRKCDRQSKSNVCGHST